MFCVLLPLLCWIGFLSFLLWNSCNTKGKFSFYAFITNNNVLSYLYTYIFCNSQQKLWLWAMNYWAKDKGRYKLQLSKVSNICLTLLWSLKYSESLSVLRPFWNPWWYHHPFPFFLCSELGWLWLSPVWFPLISLVHLKKKREKQFVCVMLCLYHLMKTMYLWWMVCTLYLHAYQVRVTVGNSDFVVVVLVLCISNANYLQRGCPSVCYEHGFSIKSVTLQIDNHFSLHLWIMLQPVQYTMVCCGKLTEVVFSVC